MCGREGFFAFDPARREWLTDLFQPPELPQAPLMTAHDGHAWVMGGHRSRHTFFYNPKQAIWNEGSELPTEQAWGAAASFNGRLLAIGGANWSESHKTFIFDDRVFALNPEDERR